MNKKTEEIIAKYRNIASIFLLVLSIIGAMFLAVLLHEGSHYLDFHNYVGDDAYICVLRINNNLSWKVGYYTYNNSDLQNLTSSEVSDYNEKAKTSEWRANIPYYFILGLCLFCMWIVLRKTPEEQAGEYY